jgi:hypothetical protein
MVRKIAIMGCLRVQKNIPTFYDEYGLKEMFLGMIKSPEPEIVS